MKRIIFLLALSLLTAQAKAQSATASGSSPATQPATQLAATQPAATQPAAQPAATSQAAATAQGDASTKVAASAQVVRYDEASNQVVEVTPQVEAKASGASVQSAPTPTVIINNNGASASAGPTASSAAPTTAATTAPTTVVAPTAAVAAPTTTTAQTTTAQTTTQATGQPTPESRADELKKVRGEMEGHTEQKIVEKLEESRLEGEKARSDKFDAALVSQPQATGPQQPQIVVVPIVTQAPAPVGATSAATVPTANTVTTPATAANGASAEAVAQPGATATATATVGPAPVTAAPAPVTTPVVSPAPVVSSAPAPAPVADHSAPYIETLDSPKSEGPESRSEYKVSDESQKNSFDGQHAYVSGEAGIVNYSAASNLKANGAAGFSVGYVTDKRIVIEGGFLYSNFNIQQNGLYTNPQYPPFENMDQYDMTLAVKYELLPGTFRPFIGAITSYTYRSYTSPNTYYYGPNNGVNSTAIDIGVTAGLDFQITRAFALGFDFRYLTNLTNHTNTAYQQSVEYGGYSSTSSLESMSYYTALLSGKFLF